MLQPGDRVALGESVLELDKETTLTTYKKLQDEHALKQNKASKLRIELQRDLNDLQAQHQIKQMRVKSLESLLADEQYLLKTGGGTPENTRQAELNLQVARLELQLLADQIKNKKQAMLADLKELGFELDIQSRDICQLESTIGQADIKAGKGGVGTWVNSEIGAAINSILDSFRSFTPQLQPDCQADYAEALTVSIERNQNLAAFMANYARMVRLPAPRQEAQDLHPLLQSVYRLMQPQLASRHIAWHWQLAPGALVVAVDAAQLEQVLINIVKNALESIGEQGYIRVCTTLQPPMLLIEDNGAGVPESIRQQLFTPFFSTKKNGQGIGLTMIRDILMNHGFPFSLATDENGITAFHISF